MPKLELTSPRELRDRVGQEVVVSDWLELARDRVDLFAKATGDRQWMHVIVTVH